MAKMGSYRWEGKEKIFRALREDVRAQVEEALEELDYELGGYVTTDEDFEDIVGCIVVEGSPYDAVLRIIYREL